MTYKNDCVYPDGIEQTVGDMIENEIKIDQLKCIDKIDAILAEYDEKRIHPADSEKIESAIFELLKLAEIKYDHTSCYFDGGPAYEALFHVIAYTVDGEVYIAEWKYECC